MIADLKPYAEYKESGLTWLGQVPRHWDLPAIRRVFRAVTHRDVRGDEVKMSMSRHLGLVPSAVLGTRRAAKSASISYSVCHVGDLVMNKYQAHAGLFGCAIHRGLITSNYTVFKPSTEANAAFFAKLFASKPYQTAFEAESYGVGDGMSPLYTGVFYRIFTVLPPLAEQATIVRFLDWANGRLERAIRAKRRVIALLNEQKQTIIHRAVTRGLDPSVPLKPSGVPWLRDIPVPWAQQALWTLSKLRAERTPGNLPLLSVFLDRGVIRYEEGGGQVHAPSLDLSNYQVVRAGDFVLNNQQAWRGSVGVSRHVGIISPAYIVLSLSEQLEPKFADYLMRSRAMVDQFVAASKGVGDIQRQIFWPFLRKVQVPVPTRAEQDAIVRHLGTATAALVHSISRLEREIDLLREYRTRLVADVVTGKLDVREAAARLPDEAPPDTVEDDADLSDESEAADEEVAV